MASAAVQAFKSKFPTNNKLNNDRHMIVAFNRSFKLPPNIIHHCCKLNIGPVARLSPTVYLCRLRVWDSSPFSPRRGRELCDEERPCLPSLEKCLKSAFLEFQHYEPVCQQNCADNNSCRFCVPMQAATHWIDRELKDGENNDQNIDITL